MDKQYNFKSIEKVNFICVRDIPTGLTEYKVTEVITDTGINVVDESEFFSNEKLVPWRQDNKIVIPYIYKRDFDSITMIVRHIPTQITAEFDITFDKWNLLFEDHFDGTELNTDVWGEIWDTSLTFEQRDPFFFGYICYDFMKFKAGL